MKSYIIFLSLIILSLPVNAQDKFMVEWVDVFPMCASDMENYNPVRCACEFLVPNLHLNSLTAMFYNILTSFFLIEDISNFLNLFLTDPVSAVGGFLDDIISTVADFFLMNPSDDVSAGQIIGGLISGFIYWLFGIITPIIVMITLLSFEFIKTYLILAVGLNLWIAVMQDFNMMSDSPDWSFQLGVIAIVLLFVGTVWLLGSDMGLYRPLVIW